MIPLMKSAFLNEHDTKKALGKFILQAKQLSMGEECARFENVFAAFQGRKDAVLFNSGGSANLAALQAYKNLGRLKGGDKVGFSSLTWATNVMPILQLGLTPVPIDCEPTTLNVMSYNLKERLIQTDLNALFVTNALGFAGDLDVIRNICNEKNIIFLEDNCEALGTVLRGGKAGNFGECSTFSFFVAHHMSTIEGGMVCTDDEEFAEMLKMVRANGWDRNLSAVQQHALRKKHKITSELDAKYTFYDLGFNFRPTEITGFLGSFQMQFLNTNIKSRENNYLTLESVVKNNSDLIPCSHEHITLLSSFAFPIICNSYELKKSYLSQFSGAGIEIRPMISGNIQNQPFYQKYVADLYNLPGTEKIDSCGFYCGNYPELTETDLETISSCLQKYV